MSDLTQTVIIEPNTIEINGRRFIPLDKSLISPWVCVIAEHPIATLTLTILRTNKKRRQKSYSSDKVQVLKQNTK